jgi:hypothetical protein
VCVKSWFIQGKEVVEGPEKQSIVSRYVTRAVMNMSNVNPTYEEN